MDSDHEEEPKESTKIQELNATIRALNTTIQELNTTISRLREARDLHRTNSNTLASKNQELEERIRALTVKEETGSQKYEFLDSDAEDQPKLLAKTASSPSPAPDHGTSIHITIGNNKKYPDVPDFYGNKAEWDSWRFHLAAKFRQSAVLFPTEYDKMEYIRDHCKSIAFDVIKARADPLSDDPYTTSQEMIEELHSMFGDFDKLTVCDTQLHDPQFAMGVKKKNETFDEFYARFSATIAPLGYSETHKISTLKRLITLKLRLQTMDGNKPSSYRQYVERLRRCDQNMRLWGISDVEEIIDEEEYVTNGGTSYPEDFRARLKEEGRCFKCLGRGHRPGLKAPCWNTKHLSFDEAKAVLAKESAVEKD